MSTPVDELGLLELALRLGLATLVGAVIGFDREASGHSAGIRTHGVVALSSAVITISALMIFHELRGPQAQPDPLRVIQGLAQAIGFIAAGLIFVRGGTVQNLTTASSIWLATALGIACGAGQWELVGLAMLFGMLLLTVVRVIKPWLPGIEKEDSGEPAPADPDGAAGTGAKARHS